MDKNRKYGLIVGILFIIGTVAGVASLPFLLPVSDPVFLQDLSASAAHAKTGALLIALMGIACANIAVWMYPVLKGRRPGLALAAVVFRGFEGMFTLTSVMFLLPLGTWVTGASEAGMLVALNDASGNMAAVMFCIGALMYYIAFWQLRLVPRWLSGWGLVAIILHTVANILVFKGAESFGTLGVLLNIPIALQEMVLAVWLIVKGFAPEG